MLLDLSNIFCNMASFHCYSSFSFPNQAECLYFFLTNAGSWLSCSAYGLKTCTGQLRRHWHISFQGNVHPYLCCVSPYVVVVKQFLQVFYCVILNGWFLWYMYSFCRHILGLFKIAMYSDIFYNINKKTTIQMLYPKICH